MELLLCRAVPDRVSDAEVRNSGMATAGLPGAGAGRPHPGIKPAEFWPVGSRSVVGRHDGEELVGRLHSPVDEGGDDGEEIVGIDD